MALKAKKPEQIRKRLKLFMYGESGVGKTTAGIQFPRAYIIDAEHGAEEDQYVKAIAKAESVILQTTDMDEVVDQVRQLRTTKHDYRTIVIDPITPLYIDLLDKAEALLTRRFDGDAERATAFGKHYGEANKTMKRLLNLLMSLDMNVIMTAHAKIEYGDDMKKLGLTFDGYKKLDYIFDLVVQLERRGAKRVAIVKKTRMSQFKDGETFDWSYKAFHDRMGETVEAPAQTVTVPDQKDIDELKRLLAVVKLPDGTLDKWLAHAGVDELNDMTAEQVKGCLSHVQKLMEKTK